MKIIQPSVTLEFITPDALQLMERAGRTCYKSEDRITDESAAKFVKSIKQKGHHTILEHAHATFRVVCDRGVSHEFVRHRHMVYSQESTRFANYSKDKFGSEITVICPPGIDLSNPDGSYETWYKSVQEAEKAYLALLSSGHPPEIARSVLPTCLKTEFVVTANFREWRHFLALRYEGTTGKPHPQIKEVAEKIKFVLVTKYPVVFGEE